MENCSYCLKGTLRLKLSGMSCLCNICYYCIEFLITRHHFFCPFCESAISKNLLEENTYSIIHGLPSSSDLLKNTEMNPDFKQKAPEMLDLSLVISKLKASKKTLMSLLKKVQIYNFTCKLIKNQEKLSKLYEFPYLTKINQQVMKDLSIFQITSLDPRSFLKNFGNGTLCKVLPGLSSIALEREKKKIMPNSKYFFLGKSLGCFMINHGSCTCEFKVISGRPRQLISLGVGISPGLNSGIFYYSIEITEDEKIVYLDDPNKSVINESNRLTYEIKLKHPVLLNSKSYQVNFRYQGIAFYAIKTSTNILETDGLILQFNFEKYKYHSLFYLLLD